MGRSDSELDDNDLVIRLRRDGDGVRSTIGKDLPSWSESGALGVISLDNVWIFSTMSL